MHISPLNLTSLKTKLAVFAVSTLTVGALFSAMTEANVTPVSQPSAALHHPGRNGSNAGSATGANRGGYGDYDTYDSYDDDSYDDSYDDDSYDGYGDDSCGYDDGYNSTSDDEGCDYGDYGDVGGTGGSADAGDDFDETPATTAGGSTLLHTFAVSGNVLDTKGATSADVRAATAIWSRFAKLIPADRRAMVKAFELRSRKYNGAYVYLDDPAKNTWVLGVQDGWTDNDELDYTLIHEFGHLLTLNAGQLQIGGTARKCSTYFFGEGCAKPDSMSARFLAQFWSPEMRRAAESNDTYLADDYPGSFVTDYAATNPAEDLAETFATFVVNNKPTRNRMADAKVNFFWSIPEMVQLRAQIRANQA